MDWDCDQLVYTYMPLESPSQSESEECSLCSSDRVIVQEQPTLHATTEVATDLIPIREALTGQMVQYVQVLKTQKEPGPVWDNALYYVKNGAIGSLKGSIYLQDAPPYGTWLAPMAESRVSLGRLRVAGLMCLHCPELNRIVLEQKNDDGLLYLTSKWLRDRINMNQGIELFGPFACDAMLAPVLHKILRSSWIEQRKELREVNHELKLGWAQEFYNWTEIPRDKSRSMVFAPMHTVCPAACDTNVYEMARCIVDEMKRCGFTPWSTVHAVRCSEVSIQALDCVQCGHWLLNSCAFLLECAASEASKNHDWLVRNEAVIQLCWVLYQIYKPQVHEDNEDVSLEAWVKSTVIHSVSLQEYQGDTGDSETLVVLFSNDHLEVKCQANISGIQEYNVHSKFHKDEGPVDPSLLDVIQQNELFKPNLKQVGNSSSISVESDKDTACCISIDVEVLENVPAGMIEAKAQKVDIITMALISCFPRVAESALDKLTFCVPRTHKITWAHLWPLFVNPTRACHALFKALSLPVSPEPTYLLELIARAWRRVPHQTLERFIPMSNGGFVTMACEHYNRHFLGPVNTLARFSLISDSEKNVMIQVLSEGVLPCFASEMDSAPDRLVSSTLALSFAACGLRVCSDLGFPDSTGVLPGTTVTVAGLLYFAAWYILVYTSALHTHSVLNKWLSRTGTDADKHLCSALNSETITLPGVKSVGDGLCEENNIGEILKALRLIFNEMLHPDIILRCAQLFVPELLMQLPFTKSLQKSKLPASVRQAIESRDVWFSQAYPHKEKSESISQEPEFMYLGKIAYGFHSSIQGTLSNSQNIPIAQALNEPESDFNPWYDSLVILTSQDNHENASSTTFEPSLRSSLEQKMVEELLMYTKTTTICNVSQTDFTHPVISQDQTYDQGLCETSSGISASAFERECQYSQSSTQNTAKPLEICPGISVDTNLGCNDPDTFLTLCTNNTLHKNSKSIKQIPEIESPCMTMITNTVYTKVNFDSKTWTQDVCAKCNNLIEALWVLFAYKGKSGEPHTAEALAVLVHLAAKRVQVGQKLDICNNIQSLIHMCQEEKDFLPIVAIVGGLFKLNVTLHVKDYTYEIFNVHYRNVWAPGSVLYTNNKWHVMLYSYTEPVVIPKEQSTLNCYHQGTIQAYIRMNNLKVQNVPSDDYCGFHTVATLLRIRQGSNVDKSKIRRNLALKTAHYMQENQYEPRIKTYLNDNNIKTVKDIVNLLTQEKRWLHVHEVGFLLEANGVQSEMITEYSYPIYNPTLSYYLIKGTHFEPVIPV